MASAEGGRLHEGWTPLVHNCSLERNNDQSTVMQEEKRNNEGRWNSHPAINLVIRSSEAHNGCSLVLFPLFYFHLLYCFFCCCCLVWFLFSVKKSKHLSDPCRCDWSQKKCYLWDGGVGDFKILWLSASLTFTSD